MAVALFLWIHVSRLARTYLMPPRPLFWGMVGLFEITNPQPPAVSRQRDSINQGESCLVFYCSDLDPVTDALRAGGHTILCEPVRLRIGEQVKQREMCFRDPDGALINLIEWDPEEARRPEQA